ncbi:50S ribosomal protein L1 [Candidatus Nanohalobium constans]|uniref:Ribosomal protein n=1 Tax=Candidatus Nanohalobium constans TaxID=2565781 RepID=A0A5Q0UEP0_9ARCH|nr:50S ribosomal protein L1 [Candidatus Nanohalobium constans]QGA80008.1 50S ribosomal protein L1 [Candidatus Nanohalobium constans]
MNFEEAVEQAVEEAEDRNFTESVDLVFNFRDLDLSDPNNRFNEDIKLPYQADEEIKVAVIGDSITQNLDNADKVITENELEDEYFDEPSNAKDLAEEFTFLLAEAPLMPKIGSQLGQVLGPRNMMPDPVQPGEDPSEDIEDLRNTVTLRLAEDPLMQVKIGNEEQDLGNVAMNADTIYEFVSNHLPKGDNNLKNVLIKTTMGPTVEVN